MPPPLDDHKPKVGMRAPGRLNHKHVWIYLSKLEFISCLVFLLDGVRAVLSPAPSEMVRSLWEAIESCEVKVVHFFSHPRPSLPEPA